MNITFTNTTDQFTTNDVYNIQSVSTQYLHESFLSHNDTNVDFKILNAYVLVKDQVYVQFDTEENGVMLVSSVHLSYLLPTSAEISDLDADFSDILSSYYMNDASYEQALQDSGIIDDTTNVTVSFHDANDYKIIHPLSVEDISSSIIYSQEMPSIETSNNSTIIYILVISTLSTIVMILSIILLQVTGLFDITSPCKTCTSRSYESHDDESSIGTKSLPQVTTKTIEPRIENVTQDFKITPLRGIYKPTDEEDSVMYDISMMDSEIDVSIDYNDKNSLGITGMHNLPTTASKKNRQYDPTRFITNNTVASPLSNSTIPTLSKSSSYSASYDDYNKENIRDYHMA